MKRMHALLIALALGVAIVAGTFAAMRTTQLGASSTPRISDAQYLKQTRALARAEAALRAELRRKPTVSPVVAPAPAVAPAQSVIYHRPAPIVRVVHRSGGEREAEQGNGAGLDD